MTAEEAKYVICDGLTGTFSAKCEVQSCDMILGSFFVASVDTLAQPTMDEMIALRKIKRITGYESVQQTSYGSMSFLENLERIDGQELYSGTRCLSTTTTR